MAATIALLANKGELQGAERKVGRAKDRDIDGIDKTGVRLEHRDGFGRLLNPKEAYVTKIIKYLLPPFWNFCLERKK
jgi:hypothetical protein